MVMKTINAQKGFTIIEIIIVVIILGLLAVTALPRFLDTVDEAEDASLEGVTGAFATGVGLVRAQWEVSGRPKGSVASGAASATNVPGVSFVTIDNKRIGVDGTTVLVDGSARTLGYPTAAIDAAGIPVSVLATSTVSAEITADRCVEVFNTILQNPPAASVDSSQGDAEDLAALLADNKFVVAEGTGTAANICFYFQSNGLNAMPTPPATATNDVPTDVNFNYFWYNPATGVVQSVRNKL